MYLRDQLRQVSKVKQQANNNNTIIVTVSSVGKFCSFSLLNQTYFFFFLIPLVITIKGIDEW